MSHAHATKPTDWSGGTLTSRRADGKLRMPVPGVNSSGVGNRKDDQALARQAQPGRPSYFIPNPHLSAGGLGPPLGLA